MPRLDCLDGTQRSLLEQALQRCSTVDQLAKVCGVHPRTIRDWRREKHRMSYDSLRCICTSTGISEPTGVRLLPDYWHIQEAARLGGQRRTSLYRGSPGTPEGRRKGGQISSARFQANPTLAKTLGFQVRKAIRRPKKSALLAEFIGIMLGDGCLSSQFQVGISFNANTDRAYGMYLQSMFRTLFDLGASIQRRVETYGWTVVASSRALVEYLQVLGLVQGSKVANQVDLPSWIWSRPAYRQACLRGLMDTDGSVYRYRHCVYGRLYSHVAMCFTNHSEPLLRSVKRLLSDCQFHPRAARYHIVLNRATEIRRYFKMIGTRNVKHRTRFQSYLGTELRRGARGVESAALEKR